MDALLVERNWKEKALLLYNKEKDAFGENTYLTALLLCRIRSLEKFYTGRDLGYPQCAVFLC